jgi:hypothetical protein
MLQYYTVLADFTKWHCQWNQQLFLGHATSQRCPKATEFKLMQFMITVALHKNLNIRKCTLCPQLHLLYISSTALLLLRIVSWTTATDSLPFIRWHLIAILMRSEPHRKNHLVSQISWAFLHCIQDVLSSYFGLETPIWNQIFCGFPKSLFIFIGIHSFQFNQCLLQNDSPYRS